MSATKIRTSRATAGHETGALGSFVEVSGEFPAFWWKLARSAVGAVGPASAIGATEDGAGISRSEDVRGWASLGKGAGSTTNCVEDVTRLVQGSPGPLPQGQGDCAGRPSRCCAAACAGRRGCASGCGCWRAGSVAGSPASEFLQTRTRRRPWCRCARGGRSAVLDAGDPLGGHGGQQGAGLVGSIGAARARRGRRAVPGTGCVPPRSSVATSANGWPASGSIV